MKRLTLNETWKLCLSMWRWIAKQVRAGSKEDITILKEQWCDEHGFGEEIIDSHCFFCEYHSNHNAASNKPDVCKYCPGVKVESAFSCMDDDCHYDLNPIAFYNKLVSLNSKRLKKK